MATNAPRVLGTVGRKHWRDVTGTYTLRVDELRTLESACRQLDMVAEVTAEWEKAGRPLTSTGSMGQLVEHPNLATMDRAMKAYELYMKRLNLPDEVEGEPEVGATPNQHRSAASAKWAGRRGTA